MDRNNDCFQRSERTHSRSASWSLQRNHYSQDASDRFGHHLGPLRNALAGFTGLRPSPPERSASPDGDGSDFTYHSVGGPESFSLGGVSLATSSTPTSAPAIALAHRRGSSGNLIHFGRTNSSHSSVGGVGGTNGQVFDFETAVQMETNDRAENQNSNSNSPEFQQAMRWLQKIVPFALLCAAKLLWDHGLGVLVFVGLCFMFFNANKQIRRQVAVQDRRHHPDILKTMIFVSLNVALIYYVFPSQKLYRCLILMTPVIDMDVWNIMWCVGITGLSKKLLQALAQIANLINYVDFCRLCCSLPDDGAKMSCLVDL
eukprot:m.41264 g.41264  ORF g.41264 m.41264 type:complete len:315 (+) comp33122_c0_seq2:96-1040(+)